MAQSSAPSLPGPLDPQLPQDYKRVRLQLWDGGIKESSEPEHLAENELQASAGLFWYDGQILVDSGYSPFGPTVAGTPHVPFQVFYPNGTTQLLLLTTTTLYVLGASVPAQWQYVPFGGPSTITSASAAGAATAVVVTNPAIFANNLPVTILLANGLTFNTTVASVAGTTINLNNPIPAAGVNAGAYVRVVYTPVSLNGAVNTGSPSIIVNNTNGILPGANIGVTLSNGEQWQFTVLSVFGTTITPVGGATCPAPGANTGAPVAVAPVFAGSLTIQPVFVAFPANGWVIFCNGHDPIMYYDGTTVFQLPGLPDGTSCEAMNVFHANLFIGNLLEAGVELPQRVRMSDQGDPTGWVPGQNGIAAIYNLVDTEDFILSLNLLGPWLIVYRETTIMRGSFLGLPLQTMYWEYMVFGEGIQSQGAVAEIGETHFIVGTQGVYEYAGGYDLTSVGDNIFAQLLSAKGDLNPGAKSTLFTQYVADQDEAWIFYPSKRNTLPDTMLRCSLEKHAWYPRQFLDAPFVSAGFFLPLTTTTWASAIGTWAQNTAAWNSRVFLLNAPTVILCAPASSQTFVYDYNTPTDNGVAIPWTMTWKDLGDGDSVQRWDSVVLYGKGNGITVEYALDPPREPPPAPGPPVVFTAMTTPDGLPFSLNFGAGASRQKLTFNATSTYLRVRLSGTDPTFTLSWAELWHSFESEW